MMKRRVIALISVAALVGIFAGGAWATTWQPNSQLTSPPGQGTVLQILAEKLGMNPAELQKLWTEARIEAFSAFQRVPPARAGRGNGQGLTLRARDGTGPRCRR